MRVAQRERRGWIERVARTASASGRARIATGVLLVLSFAIYVVGVLAGAQQRRLQPDRLPGEVHFALDWWTPFGSLVLREWFAPGSRSALGVAGQIVMFVGGTWWLLRHLLPAPWAAAGTLLVVGLAADVRPDRRDLARRVLHGRVDARLRARRRGDPGRRWASRRRRWAWLVLALASAAFAYLSRQNGVVVVIGVVLATLGTVAAPGSPRCARWRRWAARSLSPG